MLKANSRLRKNKEFDLVFKKGRSAYGQFLGLKSVPNNDLNSRFGIIISTKVSKLAVARNRYKRQIRDILKTEQGKMKASCDCVIIVTPKIINKTYLEIEAEIKKAFTQLKLY